MTIRRKRIPTVPVESRASAALERRRVRQLPETQSAPEVPTLRAARRVPRNARSEQSALGEIKRAPNTDEVYGDAIRSSKVHTRPMRSGDYLHVSDLIHRCVRARALLELNQITMPRQTITLSDRMTFAMGDAIHDEAKALAREGSPNLVWGKWSCKCGYLQHEDPCTFAEVEPEECPHCRTAVDRYQEVSIFDDEFGIVGNPDLLFWLPRQQAFHVSEIKSIADAQWKELRRPKPEHILQVVFYWLLCRRKGMPVTDQVSIIYFTKGWLFGNQSNYKEFLVDPQAELHRLDDMITDAKAYKAAKAAVSDMTLLPVKTCATSDAKPAKSCGACELCFSI